MQVKSDVLQVKSVWPVMLLFRPAQVETILGRGGRGHFAWGTKRQPVPKVFVVAEPFVKAKNLLVSKTFFQKQQRQKHQYNINQKSACSLLAKTTLRMQFFFLQPQNTQERTTPNTQHTHHLVRQNARKFSLPICSVFDTETSLLQGKHPRWP